MKWFCYDPLGDGFVLFDSPQKAENAAQEALAFCADAAADDGWPEETPLICWGAVHGQVRKTSSRPDPDGRWDTIDEYELVNTESACSAYLAKSSSECWREHQTMDELIQELSFFSPDGLLVLQGVPFSAEEEATIRSKVLERREARDNQARAAFTALAEVRTLFKKWSALSVANAEMGKAGLPPIDGVVEETDVALTLALGTLWNTLSGVQGRPPSAEAWLAEWRKDPDTMFERVHDVVFSI